MSNQRNKQIAKKLIENISEIPEMLQKQQDLLQKGQNALVERVRLHNSLCIRYNKIAEFFDEIFECEDAEILDVFRELRDDINDTALIKAMSETNLNSSQAQYIICWV